MKNLSFFKQLLLRGRRKFKYFLIIPRSFVALLLILILQSCATPTKKTLSERDRLLKRYRQMRLNTWQQYKPKKTLGKKPITTIKKKKSKQTSVSMEHLKDNPIFQQVTQIHCFKIRASESRCNAIKYLAMANCGNITKESQIKKYKKCLEKNFK